MTMAYNLPSSVSTALSGGKDALTIYVRIICNCVYCFR